MTNELAIKILNGDVIGTTEQTHDAIKIAIKALLSPEMKETQTLSYSLLCKLYDEIKELEKTALDEFLLKGRTDYERTSAILTRTSTIKYLVEDKLFLIWKEINKNE